MERNEANAHQKKKQNEKKREGKIRKDVDNIKKMSIDLNHLLHHLYSTDSTIYRI